MIRRALVIFMVASSSTALFAQSNNYVYDTTTNSTATNTNVNTSTSTATNNNFNTQKQATAAFSVCTVAGVTGHWYHRVSVCEN